VGCERRSSKVVLEVKKEGKEGRERSKRDVVQRERVCKRVCFHVQTE